ncbi:MAG: NlpC/P60 family protein [Acidimicrobiales bacterium]
MGRLLGVVAAGMVVASVALGGCVSVVVGALGSPGGAGVDPDPGSGTGGPAVPASWVELDQAAAALCPGLSWSVLAAIGRVESDSGRSSLPGVSSGANGAGAEGPMQFEPATFAEYATVGPGGAVPPSPYDPVDAVYSAATMLCDNGGGSASGLPGAIFDYNHSTVYVDTVLVLAQALAADPALGSVPAVALAFAASAFGVPYVWGGTGPGGYDCSGLVQAAYRAAGVTLPRVAQDQFDAGPAVALGAAEPGDLVFFGDSASGVEHVGLYVGSDTMIDAPYTGTVVREDPLGTDLVGVTRPGG